MIAAHDSTTGTDGRTTLTTALVAIESSSHGLADTSKWNAAAVSPLLALAYVQTLAQQDHHDRLEAARRTVEDALRRLGSGSAAQATRELLGAEGATTRGELRRHRRAAARGTLGIGDDHFRTRKVQELLSTVAVAVTELEVQEPTRRPSVVDGRSSSIGVIAPLSSEHTTYHVDLVRALREAVDLQVEEHRRRLVVLDVPREDPAELEAILADDLTVHLSGLIVVNARIPEAARTTLIAAKVPVVSITQEDAEPPVVCTVLPDHAAFQRMLEHVVVGHGCTCAVLLTRGPRSSARDAEPDAARVEKRTIFQAIARRHGLRSLPDTTLGAIERGPVPKLDGHSLIVDVDHYRHDHGHRLFTALGGHLPSNTCVCFLADVVAVPFLHACDRSGRSAAERGLRVTGFDNTPPSKTYDLTTVDYQLNLVARDAYHNLQIALDSPRYRFITTTVDTVHHLRGSTEW